MRTRIASAGTGKTTALVQEILTLIKNGTPLRRIAAITYTRKAATEFRTRIHDALMTLTRNENVLDIHPHDIPDALLHEAIAELDANTVGTIHAFMRRLITSTAPELSIDPHFTLMSEHESKLVFQQETTTLEYLRVIHLRDNDPDTLMSLFEQRSLNPTPDAGHHANTERILNLYQRIMTAYRARLNNQRLAPSDLEYVATQAAQNPNITRRWRERVTHVLIDESQDVNPTQAKFIRALEQAGIHILMVGDPKQSIYAFRHADVDSFRLITHESTRDTPLTTTYRHATTINRFLTRYTNTLANQELGFLPTENPPIITARSETGSVTIHWITGERYDKLDDLREHEANALARTLTELHHTGVPYHHMSILTRARTSQDILTRILKRHNLPHVIIQGRDYYNKTEIRDLYHALKYIQNQNTLSLTVTLTSPYCNHDTQELHTILNQPNPHEYIRLHHPRTHATLERLTNLRNEPPRTILHTITYDPIIHNHSYASTLTEEQNDNIDTIMTLLNPNTHANLEHLTAAFQALAGQEEAGDVPQNGDGIRITTIHASKGLEWPVVAVFDLGRGSVDQKPDIIIEPTTGLTATVDSPHYATLHAARKERETHEIHRLMYVAYSRARDHLIITGSSKGGKENDAVSILSSMRVGPGVNLVADSIRITTTPATETPAIPAGSIREAHTRHTRLSEGPATHATFPHATLPLVQRPSHASHQRDTASHEVTEKRYNDEGDDTIITEAAIVGTLTHHAIGERWTPSDPTTIQSLAAQAILAPLPANEKQRVLAEAMHLLEHHASMVGTIIPPETLMHESHREVPFTYRDENGITWNGIIDHLYRMHDRWFIHDYKTDHTITPHTHTNQMRLYHAAIQKQLPPNANLTTQLVYLRHRTLVTVPPDAEPAIAPPAFTPATTPATTPASAPAPKRHRTPRAARNTHTTEVNA